MKNKIFVFVILSFFSLNADGQHFPLLSNYEDNANVINPAFTPFDEIKVSLFYRNMWTGLPEAPKSIGINANYLRKRMSFGLFMLNDKAGIFNQNIIHLNYSYKIFITDKINISFGMSGGLDIYEVKLNELILREKFDPKIQAETNNSFLPDFNIGFIIDNKKGRNTYVYSSSKTQNYYYVGLSIQHIINVSKEKSIVGKTYLLQHYNLMAAYRHFLSKDFELEESTLLKYVKNVPFQADFGLKVHYLSKYYFGLAYRTSKVAIIKLGLSFEKFDFAYAYDYSTNRVINRQSNEFSLSYRIE